MSVLVIISAYRLYSVLYPFKPIRIKVAVILMVLVWIVWMVVAIVPVFNETLFAHKVTRAGYANPEEMEAGWNSSCKPKPAMHFIQSIINNVEILANASIPNDTLFSQVISQSNVYQTNEVMVQLLTSFNLVDLEKSRMKFLGYYAVSKVCTIDLFVTKEDGPKAGFSLVLLIYSYLYIVTYIGVT